MAGMLAPPAPVAADAAVRTLRAEDVAALRLPGARGDGALLATLESHPGRSVWVPATLEYAVLAPWRNRPEIASVKELVAVRHLEPLLRAAYERCVELGDDLLLAVELESRRSASRYERAGLELLEEVITYEIDVARAARSSETLKQVRVDPRDVPAIDHVVAIDQAAFPWLWRNNRLEFDVYLRTAGVEVSLVEADGEPVGYIGVTNFGGWGHLDRMAIAPARQGLGYGREALALAVATLRRQGARRVALSTQRTNRRSQRLYERFGFHRTPELDYRLFGAWCRPGHDAVHHTA